MRKIPAPYYNGRSGSRRLQFRVRPWTWMAEGEDFLSAYHELHKRVVG